MVPTNVFSSRIFPLVLQVLPSNGLFSRRRPEKPPHTSKSPLTILLQCPFCTIASVLNPNRFVAFGNLLEALNYRPIFAQHRMFDVKILVSGQTSHRKVVVRLTLAPCQTIFPTILLKHFTREPNRFHANRNHCPGLVNSGLFGDYR